MTRFLLFAFVCSLLVLLSSGMPSGCTSPMMLAYSTPDCTGPAEKLPFYPEKYCPDTCLAFTDNTNSGNYTCDSTHLSAHTFYQAKCRGPSLHVKIRTQACVNRGKVSSAYVCHLKDVVHPPHSSAGPTPGDGPLKTPTECPWAFYCKPNVPFVTYFTNSNCSGYGYASYEFHAGALLDICYFDSSNQFNIKYECNSRDHQLIERTFANGCDEPDIYSITRPTGQCIFDASSGFSLVVSCGTTSKRDRPSQALESLSEAKRQELQALIQQNRLLHGQKHAMPFTGFQFP